MNAPTQQLAQAQVKDMPPAKSDYSIPTDGMAPGLAIMFNDKLYQRCRDIAMDMSKADGFTPPHLIGKPYACFAVLTRSITWKLDPLAVAQSTYQTPGGKIGYEGKLVQAILENSGKFEGPIRFEHIGDWSKIRGKWKKGKSPKGYDIPQQAWEDKDEDGLGVRVYGKVKGEVDPREFTMWLKECFPRNSTLWPLRPEQQICYTAVRAFGNIAAAGLLMGVPFSTDFEEQSMVDVTPARPRPEDFKDTIQKEPVEDVAEDEAATTTEEGGGEYGAYEARQDGQKAFFLNVPHDKVPGNIAQLKLTEAWQDGWKTAQEEAKEEEEAQAQAQA